MFEQLFTTKWISQRPFYAFLLGLGYSVLGIFSAFIVFPENIGLMSISFTSLLIVLSLSNLLTLSERREIREKKLSIKLLFRDHKDIFEIYIFLFLGMLLTFSFFAIVLPEFSVKTIFSNQLSYVIGGGAVQSSTFLGYLKNNVGVLLICFVLSLVYGAGSILFLTWNASVWGSIFGYVARSAFMGSNNPFVSFGILFAKVFPHMFFEALSYFFAIVAGGVISKALIAEKENAAKFKHVFTDGVIFFVIALILLVLAAYLEAYIFPILLRL
jgi:uncharacterized membrane protein SpoIIM required for sporulation